MRVEWEPDKAAAGPSAIAILGQHALRANVFELLGVAEWSITSVDESTGLPVPGCINRGLCNPCLETAKENALNALVESFL